MCTPQPSLLQAVPGPEALNSVPPEQQRQPQGPGGDSGAGGSSSGQFLPVLLINLQGPGSEQTSEACEKLAWGGGPAYLLAAANKQHVHIFSLRHYFLHEAAGFVQATWDAAAASHAAAMAQAGGDAAGAAQGYGIVESGSQPSLPLPSSSWQLVASYRLSAPLLAMDWTLRADGLLLSDAAHSVTMLEIEVHGLDSLYVAQVRACVVSIRTALWVCAGLLLCDVVGGLAEPLCAGMFSLRAWVACSHMRVCLQHARLAATRCMHGAMPMTK